MKPYKVLVPIEDEYFAILMVNYIIDRPWIDNTIFQIVHVVAAPPMLQLQLPQWYHYYTEEMTKLVWKLVENITTRIKHSISNVTVQGNVVQGYPKEEIISIAESWGADLIIMGSHGRSNANMELFPLGGVSAAVSAHAPCPVLIIRVPGKTQTMPATSAAMSAIVQ